MTTLPDPPSLSARATELETAAAPLVAHWNASLAAHVLYLALNLKCMADSRHLPRLAEAAKGLVHFLHHRMNQGHGTVDMHFADELRTRLSMIVQYAAPSVKVTPIAHSRIGQVSLLAPQGDDAPLARHLENFGIPVQRFTTVSGLAEAASQQVPAAVIVLGDPHANNNHLSHVLAALKHSVLPESVMLILSPDSSFDARLAAVRAGARGFLPWPCPFNEVLDTLTPLLARDDPVPLRVLLVEDMESLASFYATVLAERGMDSRVVSNPHTLLDTIITYRPDLILLDMALPECTGLELAGVIRQQRYLDNIPILFVTSEKQRPRHLDAHDIGVDGFLVKPVPADVLAMTVMARARRHRRLAGHITTDSLTGLLNHSQLLSQLDMELARTLRQHEVLSFALLNIDHFKDVNDTHGHPSGDQVLRTLARILRERLRRSDIVGRLGGDEFGVIMPATEPGEAKVLLESLMAAFRRVAHSADTATFWLGFRAGVSSTHGGQASRTLLAQAAQAVQQAKLAGGEQVWLADVEAQPVAAPVAGDAGTA